MSDLPETYETCQEAIDTIWISSRLVVLDGVYAEFGAGIDSFDDRSVWLKISEVSLFGKRLQQLKSYKHAD